jgi:APA family basic amino acid/polyamine antiporter
VLTIFGVYILRVKQPNLERPYKAFGYPVLPAIYILMGISFCVLLLVYKRSFALYGLGIVLIGIPIYYITKYFSKKNGEADLAD